jgi:hypothetical protein
MVLSLIAGAGLTGFTTTSTNGESIFHGGHSTFKRKTLKSMIEQTHWTHEDLVRLGLVKK